MCFLHGRHREGLQWQIQRAEEQWVSVDTCSRGAGPKTKVRDASLNSELSLSKNMFFCLWQQSVCSCCCYCSAQTSLNHKNKQSHKTPVFPSCSSPKTNSCQCFYICARGTEFTPNVFFFFACCCWAGRAAAPVRAQRLPTSRPPPSPMTHWLSSSRTHWWTSPSPRSTTDPTSPVLPAGRDLFNERIDGKNDLYSFYCQCFSTSMSKIYIVNNKRRVHQEDASTSQHPHKSRSMSWVYSLLKMKHALYGAETLNRNW